MDFFYVFGKMIQLFLIIIIGYLTCRCGVFGKEARLHVTRLVLYVAIPGLTLSSVLSQDNLPGITQILGLLAVAFSSYVVLFACAWIVPMLLRVEPAQVGIYRFMVAFANVGFIGYPVTQAIFGDRALFYTCVFNLPFNFLAFSVGVIFVQKSAAAGGQDTGMAGPAITYKTFLTPCLIFSVLAIVIALCGWKAPAIICDTAAMLGNITTPAALLIIGSSLAEMRIREMFGNWKIYLFAAFRLLILPVIIYFIYRGFVTDELLLGECVIISAMPVATNGTMLCLQYNVDEKLMAQGTFITTLASLVTIPVLAVMFA